MRGALRTKDPLEQFCRRILEEGELAPKLEPADSPALTGFAPSAPPPKWPARVPKLTLVEGNPRLPPLRALSDKRERSRCLERFAHHELMAVEMLAWAILRWPDVPVGLRNDWLLTLGDEQRHCRMYLERLRAHDGELGDEPPGGYFWKQVERMDQSHAGPRSFLAGLGLTLEQANLDFTLYYAEGFRRAGDPESADVLEEVHRDEIRHVASAREWLGRLSDETDETRRYVDAVPFPLSAARAKGKDFRVEPRRLAGLSDGFIDYVREARKSR